MFLCSSCASTSRFLNRYNCYDLSSFADSVQWKRKELGILIGCQINAANAAIYVSLDFFAQKIISSNYSFPIGLTACHSRAEPFSWYQNAIEIMRFNYEYSLFTLTMTRNYSNYCQISKLAFESICSLESLANELYAIHN